MRSKVVRLLAAVSTGVALLVPGLSAEAAEPAPPKKSTDAAPTEVVFAGRGVAVEHGHRTFYPTGPAGADALVVLPDDTGQMPGGLTQAQAQAIVDDGGAEALVAALNATPEGEVTTMAIAQTFATGVCCSWYTFTHPTAHWGFNESATTTYWFAPQIGTQQWVCAQGLGYYKGYNGSTFGVWSMWYTLGCKKAGVGTKTGTVPWGKVVAYPKAEFQSQHYTIASNGQWGY